MGKARKKAWKVAPVCIFWIVWKERNLLAFENAEIWIHRMKYSFVCNLWSWSRASINMGSISLVSFIDWLGSK